MNFVLNAYTLSECMDVMADYVEKYELEGRKNIIFCEDRLTLIAERALTRRMGGTFFSSVTTFARFLQSDEKIISKQGSVMAIGGIMATLQRQKALKCFTSVTAIENSARCVYETIAQLSASEVTPDTLQESAVLLPNDVLKDKVCDLALIYREYTAFLQEKGYLDESKYLALLPERIRAEKSLHGANVFFLAFSSFTSQAMQSVRAAIEKATDVIGIFCGGQEEIYTNDARDLFYRVCKEYGRTEFLNLGAPIGGDAEILRKGLYHLESLRGEKTLTDGIRLFEGKDANEEVEYIAVQIKKLLDQKKLRYRDFAVLIPDTNVYSMPIRRTFKEYGIPFFFDEKKSLKKHPLSEFILSALETVRERFSAQSVQSLTQNYFFGESDEYRNYLLKFANYRGGALKPLRENDIFDMRAVEDGRSRFHKATKNIKRRGYGREFCNAIRVLMEDFQVEKSLEKLKEELDDVAYQGYLSQIFVALQKVLAEAELLTSDREMSVAEFQGILSEGLNATELSLIPLKTDAVFIGDISASRIEKIEVLFVAGMTEDVPRNTEDTALVSDKEIERLGEVKTKIEPTVAQVNLRTRESMSLNLCAFIDRLYLSYPLGSDGKTPALSETLRYVKGLFKTRNGELKVERGLSDEDFVYCCSAELPAIRRRFVERDLFHTAKSDTRRGLSVAEALYRLGKGDGIDSVRGGQVSIERGGELFFHDGRISPTTLETYFNCPFKNFLSQGLRVKEREETLVLALDTGNFVHAILEKLTANIENLATESDAKAFARTVGEELLKNPLYTAQADTASGKYSAESLLREGETVATAVYRQIKGSAFKVFGIEKKISSAEFHGKIDRMDVTDKYVRIVDYKTGAVKAEAEDYYTGRKIQIQLYMSEVKGDLIPAGVFYFPAKVEYKSESDAGGRYRMLGYVNGDLDALRAGDTNLQEGEMSEFFEARLDENKKLEKVMDQESFERFLSYSTAIARQARKELKDGFVAPTPYDGACAYCAYGGACGRNCEKKARKETNVKPQKIADIMADFDGAEITNKESEE